MGLQGTSQAAGTTEVGGFSLSFARLKVGLE